MKEVCFLERFNQRSKSEILHIFDIFLLSWMMKGDERGAEGGVGKGGGSR